MTERRVLAGLGVLALVLSVLLHPGRLYIDTRPDLYLDPVGLLRESLSTWVPGTGLGTTNYDNGYLPVAALFSALHVLHLPAWLMMRLWRVGLLVLAALGARALYRDLVEGDRSSGAAIGSGARVRETTGAWGRVVAAVGYAVNPYVVVGAATTPVMLPYALLPWLLLALRRTWGERPWRAVAAFGLVFFVMGGFNAGVVPLFMLLGVPVVALDGWRREGVPGRRVLRGALAAAAVTVVVSAYWVVGTLSALGSANQVAAATEDPATIAKVSSLAEALRGLGSWLMYGGDSLGPFRPGFTSYLQNPFVVVTSFTLAFVAFLGAAASRSRVRGPALALAVVGLVLMVGGYPPEHPSPFGRALLWAFDHVSVLVAFRTTSKAGALALLGLALLAALGADAVAARLRGQARTATVWASLTAVAMSVTPVFLGYGYPGDLDVPTYWTAATDDLDARGGDGRVLALPAESNAIYRWRPRGVDDFAPVLLDRPVVYSRSFPEGPESAFAALGAVVGGVGAPAVPRDLLSTAARYLGVQDVLVRNDMYWSLMGSAQPEKQTDATEADRGLMPSALYGRQGLNTGSAKLPPLLRYTVEDPASPVRLFPVAGTLLVVGDQQALPTAVWGGALDGDRPFRLAAGLDGETVLGLVRDGGRVLVTDTNRRHPVNDHRVDTTGPLLAETDDTGTLRVLGGADDQTVAVYSGIRDVSATASGSVFGPTPIGRPFLAVDGKQRTAWTFGDFGTAVGQSLTVTLDAPTSLGTIVVHRPSGGGARVDGVRVDVGDRSVTGAFGADDEVALDLGEAPVDALTLTVTSVSGGGANQVSISEIDLPGIRAQEASRAPLTLARLAAQSPALARALAQVPTDLAFSRAWTEAERRMRREFTLQGDAVYTFEASVQAGPSPRWVDRWRTCRPIFRLDGRVYSARSTGRLLDGSLRVRGCTPVRLDAGFHALRSRANVVLDRLFLHSTAAAPTPVAAEPEVTAPDAVAGAVASYDVAVPALEEPAWLTVAVGVDERWTASALTEGGSPVPLGSPTTLNGFAQAWLLPAGPARTVHVTFAPQRPFLIALTVSLLGVLACLALLVPWRRLRDPGALVAGVRRRAPGARGALAPARGLARQVGRLRRPRRGASTPGGDA